MNYKYELVKNFLSLANEEGMEFETFDPKCLVVVGNLDRENMNSIQKKSFELYRANSNVEIVTYDELFGKVEDLIDIIEG